MIQHTLTIVLEQDEDGHFHGFVRELKGLHVSGDTMEQAVANVAKGILSHVHSLEKHGDKVPVTSIETDDNQSELNGEKE